VSRGTLNLTQPTNHTTEHGQQKNWYSVYHREESGRLGICIWSGTAHSVNQMQQRTMLEGRRTVQSRWDYESIKTRSNHESDKQQFTVAALAGRRIDDVEEWSVTGGTDRHDRDVEARLRKTRSVLTARLWIIDRATKVKIFNSSESRTITQKTTDRLQIG